MECLDKTGKKVRRGNKRGRREEKTYSMSEKRCYRTMVKRYMMGRGYVVESWGMVKDEDEKVKKSLNEN